MDRYDQETLKEITKQFPLDKSIQFLTRMVRESQVEKGKLQSDYDELKENYKKLVDSKRANSTNEKAMIKAIKSEALYLELNRQLNQYKTEEGVKNKKLKDQIVSLINSCRIYQEEIEKLKEKLKTTNLK